MNLLKRHVLKRCVYGVDLNPMAVELAKVSLWLDCFTLGAPLSFLDHHLKHGNSLIGARVDEVQEALECKQNEQMSLFARSQFAGVMLATDLMRHVGELEDVTAEQVKLSRSEYRKASDALAPYRRVMDVYVSKWFGNEPTKAQARFGLEPTIEFLRRAEVKAWLDDPDKGSKKLPAEQREVAETALAARDEHRFFHWELEFPEVFFGAAAGTTQAVGLKDNGGFDAVVGNPPYSSKLSTETGHLAALFYFISFRCDPYGFFIEQGLMLSCLGGRMSFIVPATWTANAYYQELRRHLVMSNSLYRMVIFEGRVFEEANVDVSLLFTWKEQVTKHEFSISLTKPKQLEIAQFGIRPYSSITQSNRFDISPALDHGWLAVGEKLMAVSDRLAELSDYISLGLRVASVAEFTSNTKTQLFPDPLILGDNLKRYEPLLPRVFFNAKTALIVGGTKNPKVYGTRQKILVQSIRNLSLVRRLVPTLDVNGSHFGGNVVGIIPSSTAPSNTYLLAILASNLLNSYFAHRFNTISLTSTFLGELPIRHIAFTTDPRRRAVLVAEGERLTQPQSQVTHSATAFEVLYSPLAIWLEDRLIVGSGELDCVHDVLSSLGTACWTSILKSKER